MNRDFSPSVPESKALKEVDLEGGEKEQSALRQIVLQGRLIPPNDTVHISGKGKAQSVINYQKKI